MDQGDVSGRAETFGEMLRRLRRAAGFSQEALAERATLSTDAVAALERGRRSNPRPATVRLLVDALPLDPDDRARLTAAGTGDSAAPSEPIVPMTRSVGGLPLIGREHEVAAVLHLLESVRHGGRVVTLLGPGGIGKTSIALRIAEIAHEHDNMPATFVDLSAVSGADMVVPAIAGALAVRPATTMSVREAIIAALAEHPRLLVLDNFEHVMGAVGEIRALLDRCTRVVILVTSRSALRLRGEQRYRVPALAPPVQADRTREEIVASPAVRLFVARAQEIDPAFEMSEEDARAVAEICRRVDGLPLAIELAAARISVLSPASILARLDRVLPMLSDGARDRPDRQRTMRAAIDWSFELLLPEEKRLCAALSVFAGGFSIEAAAAVCDLSETICIDRVSSLLDRSLIVRSGGVDGPRLSMLATIREYAAERLDEMGAAVTARQRHADLFLDLAQRLEPALRHDAQERTLAELRRERDNLRLALNVLIETGQSVKALRLGAALWRFWQMDGALAEGLDVLDRALALRGDDGLEYRSARAYALQADAALSMFHADLERAERRGREAVSLMRQLGDRQGTLLSLNALANAVRNRGFDADALPYYDEALDIAHELDDRRSMAVTMNNLGTALRNLGQLERARTLQTQSLGLRRDMGDTWGVAMILTNLAHLDLLQDRTQDAEEHASEGLALHRALGDKHGCALALEVLARAAHTRGGHDRARSLLIEAARLSREVGDIGLVASCLQALSAVLCDAGEWQRAAELLAAAHRLDADVRSPISERVQEAYDDARERIRGALMPGEFEVAWARGSHMSLDLIDEVERDAGALPCTRTQERGGSR